MGPLLNGVTTALCGISLLNSCSALPTVDLGYTIQQPSFLNTDYDVYVFYDIRYAASPTGENRFRAPIAPVANRTIQTRGEQRVCPQAQPAWQATTYEFVPKYAGGQTTFQPSDFSAFPPASTTPSSRETEDCLFLDLYVSRTVFNNAGRANGVPVFVQIYGEGYIAGAKDLNPAGFFLRDKEQDGSGIIFVSINYRLGAFGWLAGSSFQKDGDANAGLLDQQFALQWVQKHISKFGGDPKNVTAIGESAGGGSTMHQITACRRPCTHITIPESHNSVTRLFPQENDGDRNQKLPYSAVHKANAIQVYESPYGQFTYGPVRHDRVLD